MSSCIRALALVTTSLTLAFALGCGDDDGDSGDGGADAGSAGYLVDSPVAGVDYETPTYSGVTDAEGRYRYEPGETVTFSYRGVVLGSVTASPIVTPLELAGVEIPDACTYAIVRFLLTLDTGGDPDSGLSLPDGDDGPGGTLCVDDLAGLVSDLGGGPLVSLEEAEDHLDVLLSGLPTGTWRGVWSEVPGGDSGEWEGVLIDEPSAMLEVCVRGDGFARHLVCSAVVSDESGGAEVSGECTPVGAMPILGLAGPGAPSPGSGPSGPTWEGDFERDGTVTGEWSDSGSDSEGPFEGEFVSPSTAPIECDLGEIDCDTPCRIWDECTEGSYSFQECMAECTSDGGWGDEYTECLRESSCEEILEDACE